jgi:hypothetical protein
MMTNTTNPGYVRPREPEKADPFANSEQDPFKQTDKTEPNQAEKIDPEQTQVLLPRLGRNERRFATEVGDIIGPLNVAFIHEDRVVEIYNEPVPVDDDAENRLDRNKLARGGLKFSTFTGPKTKGWLEQYLTPGHRVKVLDDNGNPVKDEQGKPLFEFKEQTMSETLARSFIENPFFKKRLPRI